MKKFKKLVVVMVAAVTLMATAITVCAADNWKEARFSMGKINPSTYLADNTIHYSELLENYEKNIITFSDVDKTLMEGNVVLSVDFSDPTLSRKKITMSNSDIVDYMDGLYLMDTNGKFITEGKYPLIVNFNAPKGYVNVVIDTNWRVFNSFRLSRSYYYFEDDTDRLQIHYEIPDILVLPSYNIILEEISTSSNRATLTGEFRQNACTYYSINAKGDRAILTAGDVEYRIPHKYRGKSFYVYINGIKVGKVTLPKDWTEEASFVNY